MCIGRLLVDDPGGDGLSGSLQFHPGIETRPDTLRADEPVGLGVNLTVPQDEGRR